MLLEFSKIEDLVEKQDWGKLLSYLKEWDSDDTSRYVDLYNEWERNMLFYLGKHWLESSSGVTGNDSVFNVLEEDEDHFRPVTNYIKRNCTLKRSQVLGKKIHALIKSNSDNKDDYDASRLAYLLLKAKHGIDGEDEFLAKAFLHAQVFGICYRSDYKKPLPGQYIEIPQTEVTRNEFFQCEMCGNIQADQSVCTVCGNRDMKFVREDTENMMTGEDGNPLVDKFVMYENAISLIDPFRMKVSPCSMARDISWIQETSIQSWDWIKESFSIDAPGYLPENIQKLKKRDKLPRALRLSHEFQISTSQHHSSTFKEVSRPDPEKEVNLESDIFRKFYMMPTLKFKKGLLIAWCDSGVAYCGDPDVANFAKLKRWHPYSFFVYELKPLRFEGEAYINDQIPINIKINSLDSMIMEHIDRTAEPERVEFANVQKNNNDQSLGIIKIEPRAELPNGGAPFYLIHPSMSNEVYKLRQWYVEEVEKVANVTEIIQGIRPSGVDTYRGMQLLRDSADSAESELYGRVHDFFKSYSQNKLAIIQECLKSNNPELSEMMETIRLNENMGMNQIKEFSGEDLRNNLNVVVEEIDYAGQSKSAEVDRMVGLLESKILSPSDLDDPIVKHNLVKRFGLGSMHLRDSADIELMERIIQYAERGEFNLVLALVKPYNNPMIAMRMLTDWMKSAKYETLDPQIKQFAELKILDPLRMSIQQRQANLPPPPPGGVGGKMPPPGPPPPPMGGPPPV